MVEFGHTNEQEQRTVYESFANVPLKNTALNWVITYWLDGHGTIHMDVPRELSDLTFAGKQLIALASSQMSLIHLDNGTQGPRGQGGIVSVTCSIFLFYAIPSNDFSFSADVDSLQITAKCGACPMHFVTVK
jgi:hypothetical protein